MPRTQADNQAAAPNPALKAFWQTIARLSAALDAAEGVPAPTPETKKTPLPQKSGRGCQDGAKC